MHSALKLEVKVMSVYKDKSQMKTSKTTAALLVDTAGEYHHM